MSTPAPIPNSVWAHRRARYLKGIGIFKVLQGSALSAIGISLLFLHSHARWTAVIADWVNGELMVAHSQTMLYLLNKLQDVVAGGLIRMTGFVILFYAALLFTEGIGVYLQKRWAEMLTVGATALLIPFEVRHVWYHPGAVAILILAVNCFIVWFLYRVLRREWREEASRAAAEPVAAEVEAR